MDLSALTLKDFITLSRKKEIDTLAVIESYIKKIEEDNQRTDKINAIVYHNLEFAKKQLKNANDSNSLLAGAPIIVKNNFNVVGFPVECSSKALKNYISPYNATVTKKIMENGGVIWGSSNMDEFAMGSTNETSAHGLVRNPINRNYIPGGSSGGSAASVRANHSLVSLGSDTGGSIRQPASCCGIVGLKPTYGRVSRFGLVAFASSFDQIGPLAKTVEDAAIILKAIAGPDPQDNTSADIKIDDYPSMLENSLKGKKIAIPKEYFSDKTNPEIIEKVRKVIDFYKENGANIEKISLPHSDYGISIYYILAMAEASSNLARFDGIRYGLRSKDAENIRDVFLKTRNQGFGREVKRRMLIGTYVLSSGYFDAFYVKAQKVRSIMKAEYSKALKEYDAILTPTTPHSTFKIGEKINDPVTLYLSDLFTVPANVIGIPALSLPCGLDSNGLPIGFQLIGAPFQEAKILNLAHIYQKNNPLEVKIQN